MTCLPDAVITRPELALLVADDSHVNQRVIQAMLASTHCNITVVENGRKAVDAVRAGDFDLVLMDVQMPELDGIEATKEIRLLGHAQGGDIPIVALTANAMRGDREKCLKAGMNDYVSKPIDKRELFRAINSLTADQGKPSARAGVID